MNLIELYDSLSLPETGNVKTLNAVQVPEYPNFRIAIDAEGRSVLLLLVAKQAKQITLKNYKLKYLQLEHNINCKITEYDKISVQSFTVITFTSTERNLQEYFLKISESLIKSLNKQPTPQHVIETLDKFVEVFRVLSDPPTKSIQGIWAELFLIDNSENPKSLLYYWHNLPVEKFDFNSGEEKIEVKSSSIFERIHTFSSAQLNPPPNTQVLVASIFLRQNKEGKNIKQLIDSISDKINNDLEAIDKLNFLVCKTLGNNLEQSMKIQFDYKLAKDSLLFFRHQDISKIEKIHIPNEVTEVKYKCDLTAVSPIEMATFKRYGLLFNSL